MIIGGSKLTEIIIEHSQALKALKDENLSKLLVITPILEPKDQIDKGSAAIDLRLGTEFTVHKKSKVASYNPVVKTIDYYKAHLIDSYYVDIGGEFVLHPNQFILGLTLEWVRLPNKLCWLRNRTIFVGQARVDYSHGYGRTPWV